MAGQQFSGQVAIVTGGAQGLGKAIAEMLVKNGASVMLFDVQQAEKTCSDLRKMGGGSVECVEVDVSKDTSVQAGFETFRKTFDQLDIMVNCAGIVGPSNIKTEDVKAEDFDKTLAVNTRGSFLMTKYSLLEMKKRNYGRILLIASVAGKEGNAGMVAYSTSKAAVIGLAKSTGKEYAETGITVNSLAPAVVWTPLVEAVDPAQVKYMTDKIPKKRCGTLDEVASITRFIVSKEASFNTGFCFDLSGGRATY